MAQQYTKYQVGDTIEFPNATKKRPENFAKIVGIETNLQDFPTHYQMEFTHTNVFPENRTPTRFPITDINKQTKIVTELPAGADCPAGTPRGRYIIPRRRQPEQIQDGQDQIPPTIGGKSLRKMKKRKLRKTRRNKRKRRI